MKFDYDLCPGVVTRFGGLPCDILEPRAIQASRELLLRVETTAAEQNKKKREFGSILERYIGQINGETKVRLIQLRRDVHNDRITRVRRSASDESPFPSNIGILLKEFVEDFDGRERLMTSLFSQMETSAQECIMSLFDAFNASDAIKAIVLSAPNYLGRLQAQNLSSPSISLNQTSYTLLQYVARCATKTSPFSFFSPTAFGFIVSGNDIKDRLAEDSRFLSKAAINSSWIAQIRRASASDVDAGGSAVLCWNTSVVQEADRLLWLSQSASRDTIRSVVLKSGSCIPENLLEATKPESPREFPSVDGFAPEVQCELERVGILVRKCFRDHSNSAFRFESPANPDEPDLPSSDTIDPSINQHLLIFRMGTVADRLNSFCSIAEKMRSALNIKASSGNSGAQDASIAPDQLRNYIHAVREDVLSTGSTSIGEDAVNPLVEAISPFVSGLDPLMPGHICRYYVGHLISRLFPGQDEVPLIAFLRLLYPLANDVKDEKQSSPQYLLSLLATLARRDKILPPDNHAQEKLSEFARHIASDGIVKVAGVPKSLWNDCNGYDSTPTILGAIAQFSRDDSDLWILNTVGIGSGRVIRRWLGYSESFHQRFYNWIAAFQQVTRDLSIDVSIIDDVHFPGDDGPRLFDTYIDIPGVKDGASGPCVYLRDCLIRCDSNGFAELIDRKSGKRIFTHYENILAINVRPWTTQLLSIFGRPGWSFNLTNLNQQLDVRIKSIWGSGPIPGVYQRPRIMIGPRVAVARRRWQCEPIAMPKIGHAPNRRQLVDTYRSWQRSLALPDQIFVSCLPHSLNERSTSRYDGYKPQYIDLSCPIWLSFFYRFLEKAPGVVCIEEALPNPSELARDLGTRASEHVIHWSVRQEDHTSNSSGAAHLRNDPNQPGAQSTFPSNAFRLS